MPVARRTGAFAFALAGLLPLPAAVADAGLAANVTTMPLWQGLVRSGAGSELAVEVRSETAGSVAVRVQADAAVGQPDARVLVTGTLSAGAATTLRVPVPTVTTPVLRIEVRLPDGSVQAHTVTLTPSHAGIVVVDADIDRAGLDDAGTTVATGSLHRVLAIGAGLPHTRAGFEPVAALVVAAGTIGALPPAAHAALLDFARDCGVIAVVGSAAAAQELAAHAGCGGRHVAAWSAEAVNAASVQALASTRPRPLPTVGDLRALAGEAAGNQVRPLLLFTALYVGAMTAAVLIARSAPTLLLLPLAATAFLLAIVLTTAPQPRLVVWAERPNGATTARFNGLLSVTGTGSGTRALQWPANWQVSAANDQRVDVHHVAGNAGSTLRVTNRLLARSEYLVSGSLETPASLQWSARETVIHNRATSPSPAALLAEHDALFPIPELAAGTTWSPPPATAAMAWDPTATTLRLLRERALADGRAMLLPLPTASLPTSVTVDGYLQVAR